MRSARFYFISIVEVETRISRYLEVERPDAIKTIFRDIENKEIIGGVNYK